MDAQQQQEYDRIVALRKAVPGLFKKGGTCLYIGASRLRAEGAWPLYAAGYDITLLEVYGPNADYWCDTDHSPFSVVINEDIRFFLEDHTIFPYDVVFWWHGPEHIMKRELEYILPELEFLASRYIILACPWGIYEQGEYEGNPYEAHLSHLYPEDFVGYNTMTMGERDKRGSNLIAWKAIND